MANFLTDDGDTPDPGTVPGFLLAADNHNIGNSQGGSWFDPDTWAEKIGNGASLIATGVLSGANSFYNTGVTVGNWLGADADKNETGAWISGIDSDLGEYYSKNRTAADLVGFIAGSLVPGIAGIKVLNAGQKALTAAKAGYLGENLSAATGLLVPQTEKYIALAAGDITNATATFSTINANGIKALASGVWQQTLEGAAFETAVQATMFKSPILDDQDGWDIVKNIALGGIAGGAIGGAFESAISLGAIKRQVKFAEGNLAPFGQRNIPLGSLSPAEKIMLLTEDKEAALAPALGVTENYDVANSLYLDKIRRIDNDIRTQTHALVSGNDPVLGNMAADSIYNLDKQTVLDNLLHAEEIGRVGPISKIETEINTTAKAGKLAPELQTSFVKLTGEGAGVVTDTEPAVINIADRIKPKPGQTAEDSILGEVRNDGWKLSQTWDPTTLSGATGHLTAESRYIWAGNILKEIPAGTRVGQFDIPILERAYQDSQLGINLVDQTGAVTQNGFTSKSDLFNYLVATKETVANELLRTHVLQGQIPVEQGTEAVAKIVNTKLSRLEGTAVGTPEQDYFAAQTASTEYKQSLADKGLSVPAVVDGDVRFMPTYAKVSRRIADMKDVDGNIVDGMTWIKQQQKMLSLAVDNVYAKAVGTLSDQSIPITQAALSTASKYGSGAGLFSFANGSYGTLESTAQFLGSLTKRIKTAFRDETSDILSGPLVSLGTKQNAAIEFETLNQKITRSAKQWVRHTEDDGSEFLVNKGAIGKDGVDLNNMAAEDILAIENKETANAIDAHINRTGVRTQAYRELRSAQGLEDVKDPGVYRPIRPNPNDYPFFAFVKDPMVTGQGHTTMIHAADESTLKALIDKVPSQYQVLTKADTEDFFAARNEYDYQRTLHESMIDSNLKNSGVFSNFFSKTDPQKIVDDILQQHLREDDTLAVELQRAKNSNAYDFLEDQASAYSKINSSKFGTYSDRLEGASKNPYLDYIKTSLDISKASEHPLLYGFNKFLDTAVSKAVGAVSNLVDSIKSSTDSAGLASVNATLDHYGMSPAYRDAATDLLANHQAPKGELSKFIRGANAVLSKLTLGLDPLNAVNNFIGANILRSTELKQITDAISSGDRDLAGQLGSLLGSQLPGTPSQIMTPSKLVFNSMQNYFKDLFGDQTLLTRYKNLGVIKDASQQFKDIVDDFSLKGTESVSQLQGLLQSGFQKMKDLSATGEKLSGNKFAEELNRFISADSMRQLTDLGVAKGLLTPAEQNAYINTFVNRVEGNTIASQRPLMFQGPIGQAIGLFQSYQFNLMQQMFRYVSEGSAKDSAMLLGLQGTFFGIQGLPAFQFINQHLIGNLSGNNKHVDLYDSTYGVLGKQLGNLSLYGLPSNLLQANLYSRGDINPRQVTVLPNSLSEIPIVGAYSKFFGSVYDSVNKMANGGAVWESLLQGIEHNGLSRPLAGLAQTMQAAATPAGVPFSTSSKGSILFSNDLASWSTAVRLAGGRPLDEAIINDGVFRIQSYTQQDNARMQMLGEAIKASSIQGLVPDQGQVAQFAKTYAENGGKTIQFNKFMMNEFKAANTSQSQKIVSQLQNPFAQKMQLLMGGGTDTQPLSLLSTPSN